MPWGATVALGGREYVGGVGYPLGVMGRFWMVFQTLVGVGCAARVPADGGWLAVGDPRPEFRSVCPPPPSPY